MEKFPGSANNPQDSSRRNFLKNIFKAGAVVGATSLGLNSFANTTESNLSTKSEIENFNERQIEEAKEIIKNKEYSEIINNPFLVSALYYSAEAIKKISTSPTTNPQKIMSGICSYLTPEFRENYIKKLEEMANNKDTRKIISDKESVPINNANIPKDLSQNHQDAIDLFIKEGTPVYPMAGGIVVLSEDGWKKENDLSTSSAKGGNTVIIFNPYNKLFYRYEHLEKVYVKTGMILDVNTNIGTVGHTGLNASLPGHGGHLHLEVNYYLDDKMKATNVQELKRRLSSILDKEQIVQK